MIALAVLLLPYEGAARGQAGDSIRILISRDAPEVVVSGRGLALRDLKTGRLLFHNEKYSSLHLERRMGARVHLRRPAASAPGFLLTSPGLLALNGRSYREKLRILPGPDRDLWVINELGLEDYLCGLLNSEVSSNWPLESLKAQAVAARTFAVFQKRTRTEEWFDLDSSTADQVYKGSGGEDARSRQAVDDTEGELLMYRGEPIFAVYHACCGGKTETPQALWAGNFPYLRSTVCTFCLDSPYFLWNLQVEEKRLKKALQLPPGFPLEELEIRERNGNGRVSILAARGPGEKVEFSGKEFRRLLGYDLLRSTNFVVRGEEGRFSFSGLGWGHGVGLCQWGAKGMAEGGADYRSILRYYYRDVEVKRGRR